MAKKRTTAKAVGKKGKKARRKASRSGAKARPRSFSKKRAKKPAARKRAARKPAGKRSSKKAAATSRSGFGRAATRKKSGLSRPAPPKAAVAPSEEMYGEADWKADEEYRQGVRGFSENHDAQERAENMDEDKPPEGQKIDTEDDTEW